MDTMKPGNSMMVKALNVDIVRSILREKREMTGTELALQSGLTLVTVNSVLHQLLDTGEILLAERLPSTGGRPAQKYRYNAAFSHAAVIYALEIDGNDTLCAMIVNLFGEVIWREMMPCTDVTPQCFEQLIGQMVANTSSIRLVVCGIPGVACDGRLRCDYPAMDSIDLYSFIDERFDLPVVIENDVNAACLGYERNHQLYETSTLFYLYIPQKYSPGSALCINGNIYRGYKNFAGEIRARSFDVDWNGMESRKDEQVFAEKVGQMLSGVCAILSPRSIVICDSQMSQALFSEISSVCCEIVGEYAAPDILVSGSFDSDYENGMIALALDGLAAQLAD